MSLPIYIVDAFTDTPFHGNPAAVCLTAEPLDERLMQRIAAEIHLSETAFLYPQLDGYSLRWFTPATEVDLCGHATLASSHMLWETGSLLPNQQATFYTKSGLLTAGKQGAWIEMNFPAEPTCEAECPPELLRALGIDPIYVGRNRFDYLIEVDSEETIRALSPDFNALKTIRTRGVIVTSRSGEFDFVSRCFFPAIGVNEDPVTGSAHCGLAPYWGHKLGKSEMTAYQASSRGGVLRVALQDDRVLLAGQAVTVMRSEMFV